MKPRPDLLDKNSLPGLEVFQLTTEPDVPSAHGYMEAQIFTPDSRRFILHRSAHPHGSDKSDPQHRYLVCDVEHGCTLTPITDELGTTAPSVSPDGKRLYYFVNETEPGAGRLALKQVNLDGTGRDTIMVIDVPLPGTRFRPSHIYPLSTISSDGKRLALSCFLGDGRALGDPWGVLVFDLEKASVHIPIWGKSWGNMHAQYSRALDPLASHDILIQEDEDFRHDASGAMIDRFPGLGIEIHVIRDDGTNLRTMPWGRDGNDRCQGHQCWIGRSQRAITSTVTRQPDEKQLIEGRAVPFVGHVGLKTPGGVRNDLSREFPRPEFYHFATDIAGKRLITDSGTRDQGGGLYLADISEDSAAPLQNIRLLLRPKSSWQKQTHIHPFLSPDGGLGFFNSDESGILQAYMVRGW